MTDKRNKDAVALRVIHSDINAKDGGFVHLVESVTGFVRGVECLL